MLSAIKLLKMKKIDKMSHKKGRNDASGEVIGS
jgi:hypothetical protein